MLYIYLMKKTAIIIGATGLTGGILLDILIKDNSFEKIKLFSRNSIEINNSKVEEHIIDLLQLEKYTDQFKADVVFCCIGTTKSKTPDKDLYRKIDYGIPVTAAKLSKINNIKTFIVISALGADSSSKVFYNKTKGEMERDVLKQNIENTYILQPSLIVGDRSEWRLGESVAGVFMKIFDFLIPKRYKIIKAKTISKAMHVLSKEGYSEEFISSEKIKEIAL